MKKTTINLDGEHEVDTPTSRAEVRLWVQERLDNCLNLAREKTGDEVSGWLEDAAYFAAILGIIDGQ